MCFRCDCWPFELLRWSMCARLGWRPRFLGSAGRHLFLSSWFVFSDGFCRIVFGQLIMSPTFDRTKCLRVLCGGYSPLFPLEANLIKRHFLYIHNNLLDGKAVNLVLSGAHRPISGLAYWGLLELWQQFHIHSKNGGNDQNTIMADCGKNKLKRRAANRGIALWRNTSNFAE